MSRQATSVRGHGACVATMIGNSTRMAPAKRKSRKVSGGACGAAYFATMKPVLQMSTNANGMAASQVCRTPDTGASAMRGGLRSADPARPGAARRLDCLQVDSHGDVDVPAVAPRHRDCDRHVKPLGK